MCGPGNHPETGNREQGVSSAGSRVRTFEGRIEVGLRAGWSEAEDWHCVLEPVLHLPEEAVVPHVDVVEQHGVVEVLDAEEVLPEAPVPRAEVAEVAVESRRQGARTSLRQNSPGRGGSGPGAGPGALEAWVGV